MTANTRTNQRNAVSLMMKLDKALPLTLHSLPLRLSSDQRFPRSSAVRFLFPDPGDHGDSGDLGDSPHAAAPFVSNIESTKFSGLNGSRSFAFSPTPT